jgi:hypothetical protein
MAAAGDHNCRRGPAPRRAAPAGPGPGPGFRLTGARPAAPDLRARAPQRLLHPPRRPARPGTGPRARPRLGNTHVGGESFAANLVILPHGLYYGPVTPPAAQAAVAAYQRAEIDPGRFRGRTGQDRVIQEAQCATMIRTGCGHIPGHPCACQAWRPAEASRG